MHTGTIGTSAAIKASGLGLYNPLSLSSIRPKFPTLVAAAAVALVLCAAAVAAVQKHSTAAGMAQARHVLLNRGDLGRAWTSSPAPKSVPDLTCPAFSLALASVVQTGSAISPTFQASSTGPFASQTAYAYASGRQEQTVWLKVARPHLLTCIAASLVRSASGGVHFTAAAKRVLILPPLPVRAIGYRVTGTASVPNQTVNVYLDVLLFGGGTTVTELSLSSFVQPVARALETRLARSVARRITAG
jgi:hypothetical protein